MSDARVPAGTRLADLSPELFGTVAEGKLYFDCPVCGEDETLRVHISSAPYHERPSQHVGGKPVKVWQASGEFPDTLTLTPSINILTHEGGPTKCWHGHITNGAVT